MFPILSAQIYRFPRPIGFTKCRDEIAGALQEFVIADVTESMLNLMIQLLGN